MRSRRGIVAAFLFVTLIGRPVAAATPANHIRVIVDTSQSLRQYDPSGFVKLTTQLLYDLARGTQSPIDSFKVLPFQNDWQDWRKTNKPPLVPSQPSNMVALQQWSEKDRDAFMQQMSGLGYDAPQTYFSSSIEWALSDLKSTDATSNRVIVLITDGLSDFADADGNSLAQLKRSLRNEHVQLYVLAFGNATDTNKKWFEDMLGMLDGSGVQGRVWATPGADTLVTNVLDIFCLGFGYTKQIFSGSELDVSQGLRLERAAVVAFSQYASNVGFALKAPSGSTSPHQFQGKGVPVPPKIARGPATPTSYAISWFNPDKGVYSFRSTGAPPTQIAVLRPIRVEAELRSYKGGPVDAVMAGKPTTMEVLVRTKDGGAGDPGENVRVNFMLHYGRQDDASDPKVYNPHELNAPGRLVQENGVVVGRAFLIDVEFVRDPQGMPGPYNGFIDLIVQQSDVVVERSADRMRFVKVYPYLSITPRQSKVAADYRGRELLRAGDNGCIRFTLEGDAKQLSDASYSIGARFTSPVDMKGSLRGATFTLDGRELEAQADQATRWQARLPFAAADIGTRTHELCLKVGRPSSAANQQVEMHLGLILDSDSYYEQLNVVWPDLKAEFNIAGPDLWQAWGGWVMFLLSLLLTLLLALLLRAHSVVPPDLSISLGDGTMALTPVTLGEPLFLSRWFGRPQERPVISLSGDAQLGTVRPVNTELFVFVPEAGFRNLATEADGDWQPVEQREDGASTVTTGRLYRAGLGDKTRYFRLHYSKERPQV